MTERIADFKRTELLERDERIFPMTYAPVAVEVGRERLIRLMRYTCRLPGKPAFYDRKVPGTYNAFGASLTVTDHQGDDSEAVRAS